MIEAGSSTDSTLIKTDALGRMLTSPERREMLLREFEQSGISPSLRRDVRSDPATSGVSERCLQFWIKRFNGAGIDSITYRFKSG